MNGMTEILGAKLAELTTKSELACKGFIRLAIKDEFSEINPNLTIELWEKIIRFRLNDRLKRIHISNVDQILSALAIGATTACIGDHLFA